MIIVITGRPGAGKSYSAVQIAVTDLRHDRHVVANLAIRDPVSGRAAEPWDLVREGFGRLLSLRSTTIVLDEGAGAANSRTFAMRDARSFLLELAQIRRHGCTLIVTCHSYADLDVVLRRLTNYVVACRVALRHPWQLVPIDDRDPFRSRPPRRPLLLQQRIFDPEDYQADGNIRARRSHPAHTRYLRVRSDILAAWDSWADVIPPDATEARQSVAESIPRRRARPPTTGPRQPRKAPAGLAGSAKEASQDGHAAPEPRDADNASGGNPASADPDRGA